MKNLTAILKRTWKWWLPPLLFVALLLIIVAVMNLAGDPDPMTYPIM